MLNQHYNTTLVNVSIDAEVSALCAMYHSFVSLGNTISHIEHNITSLQVNAPQHIVSIEVLRTYVSQLRISQQTISDAMTFDNPLVWIMYKYTAYAGTEQEIRTIQDFADHCSHEGCICGKRFIFLNQCLVDMFGKNLQTLFDPHTSLDKLQDYSYIYDLIYNDLHMKRWKKYEYYCRRGRVSKWQNFL